MCLYCSLLQLHSIRVWCMLTVVFICCHGDGKTSMTEAHTTALLSSSYMRSFFESQSLPDSCSEAFPLPLRQYHPSLSSAADAGKLPHMRSGKPISFLRYSIDGQKLSRSIFLSLEVCWFRVFVSTWMTQINAQCTTFFLRNHGICPVLWKVEVFSWM